MRRMTKMLGSVVVSVNYRLAPETVYPGGLEDVEKALVHFLDNAEKYGVDPERVVIMGDSAGGNLIAATAQRMRKRPEYRIAGQVLLYPLLQFHNLQTQSYRRYHRDLKGYALVDPISLCYYYMWYAGIDISVTPELALAAVSNGHISDRVRNTTLEELDFSELPKKPNHKIRNVLEVERNFEAMALIEERLLDPSFVPLVQKNLTGLPETLMVTCEFDILRDEGILYHQRLLKAVSNSRADSAESQEQLKKDVDQVLPPEEYHRMRLCTTVCEEIIKKIFYHIGWQIGKRPLTFILLVLSITGAALFGLLRFHERNNPRETFIASDSPSKVEWNAVQSFLADDKALDIVLLLIQTSDGQGFFGNPENMNQLGDFMTEIIAMNVTDNNGKNVTFMDMSGRFKKQILAPQMIQVKRLGLYGSQNMSYPWFDNKDTAIGEETAMILGGDDAGSTDDYDSDDDEDPTETVKIYGGYTMYDVDFYPNTTLVRNYNTTVLRLFMGYDDIDTLYRWESQIYDILYESNKYPNLKGGVASENIMSKEVKKIGDDVAPFFGLVFVVLLTFIVVCSLREDPNMSKPLEAFLGSCVPLLATVTTIGLVSAIGVEFQSMAVSSMFLLLAVGFDHLFIMTSAWYKTNKADDIPERTAQMLAHSGVSMTVTTVTNTISFATGIASTTSSLRVFSIYSVVASLTVYAFEVLLFPAIMALFSHREYREVQKVSKFRRRVFETLRKIHDSFFEGLVSFISKWWSPLIVFTILFTYWTIAFYGATHVISDMDLKDLAPKESRMAIFKQEWDRSQLPMQSDVIIIQNAGNLLNETRRQRLLDFFDELYAQPTALGPNTTVCWFQLYLEYLEQKNSTFTYTLIEDFMDSGERSWINGTFKYDYLACQNDEPGCIQSFVCMSGFWNITRDREMYPVLLEWRRIGREYKDLGAVIYSERTDFADQIQTLNAFLWQSLIEEVVCMGIAFILFVPETNSIIVAGFSIFSVNLGVFGILSLWEVGVDPFSIAALLMSIGFSVDISTHISYHYYESHGTDPVERWRETYFSIGWPSMQGSLCCLIAILPLLGKPSYLTFVFCKTIFLVTSLGILHAFIVLPVVLTMVTRLCNIGRRRSRKFTVSDSSTVNKPIEVQVGK
ncbi:unnamed protein product, partial [Mesorhabditis spiculigera]